MSNEYFPGIDKIEYEGPDTDNHLAFRYYDQNKKVAGKKLLYRPGNLYASPRYMKSTTTNSDFEVVC